MTKCYLPSLVVSTLTKNKALVTALSSWYILTTLLFKLCVLDANAVWRGTTIFLECSSSGWRKVSCPRCLPFKIYVIDALCPVAMLMGSILFEQEKRFTICSVITLHIFSTIWKLFAIALLNSPWWCELDSPTSAIASTLSEIVVRNGIVLTYFSLDARACEIPLSNDVFLSMLHVFSKALSVWTPLNLPFKWCTALNEL